MSKRTRRALVETMAEHMNARLEENTSKGDDWRSCDLDYLIEKLQDNALLLDRLVLDKEPAEDVWREAADVANFAAMIADSYEH
jgi:hypothetical protein